MSKSPLAFVRVLGLLEGISFLLLLGVAMPLKYLAGLPQAVRVVGSAHGLLFVLFVMAVLHAAVQLRWTLPRVAGALLAAVVPFGPFILDGHLRRESETSAG